MQENQNAPKPEQANTEASTQQAQGTPPGFYGQAAWQNGGAVPPDWNMPQPVQTMTPGVKAFLIVLAVLAFCFIAGFGAFGVYVTVQQSARQEWMNNTDENRSDWAGESADKIDPGFAGIALTAPRGEALTPEQVYQKTAVSMVSVLSVQGDNTDPNALLNQGSGVIATANGYVITNAHVLDYDKTARVTVVTWDQKQYNGVVTGIDRDTDLAVVKIEADGLTPAEFGDSADLSVGETVFAIGNPGGVRYSGSMTMGIVSALNRSVESYSSTGITYIQTDTAISPGSSGGGLINRYGQVVGINTIKVVSSGYEGMGFSIPVRQAKQILETLIQQGSIPAIGRLGIVGTTRYLPVQGAGYSVASGVQVFSLDEESPLNDTALQPGDLIVGFNGAAVSTLEDIYAQLKDCRVGQQVTLQIRRITEGEEAEFEVQTTILKRIAQDTAEK